MQFEKQDPMALLADRAILINLIQKLINQILVQTKQLSKGHSKFHCKDVPNISVGDYLKRIAKYSHCSNSVYVAALIYIDRLQQRVEEFYINKFCIHRLMITSLMVAAKYLDDFYYKNQYYAKIGGISQRQIDQMELQMMRHFNFSVFIREEQFVSYIQKLKSYHDVNQ